MLSIGFSEVFEPAGARYTRLFSVIKRLFHERLYLSSFAAGECARIAGCFSNSSRHAGTCDSINSRPFNGSVFSTLNAISFFCFQCLVLFASRRLSRHCPPCCEVALERRTTGIGKFYMGRDFIRHGGIKAAMAEQAKPDPQEMPDQVVANMTTADDVVADIGAGFGTFHSELQLWS